MTADTIEGLIVTALIFGAYVFGRITGESSK